jgi:hypothetical protein
VTTDQLIFFLAGITIGIDIALIVHFGGRRARRRRTLVARGATAGADGSTEAFLNRHAHELAEQQRREMRAPGQSYDAARWNRCVDMTADCIDPAARP